MNATLGDVKRANKVSWIASDENRNVTGYIQKLQIVFLLESSHIPEEFYSSQRISLVPEDAAVLAIEIMGRDQAEIFSGPRNTSHFFPKLP